MILGLTTITGTFVAAMPFSCMPVLFQEISEELNLSLVEIGTVWGLASLAGIFVSLIAGLISDKFGIKLVVSVSCLLVGITGALRGLADSYFILALTVFLNGVVRLIIPVALTKTVGIWFRGKNLGLAMGISAMGMGLGLMLGPMISATVLSPYLDGWRNVMYFYGAISAGVGLLWVFFGREREQTTSTATASRTEPFFKTVSKLFRLKGLWLLGLNLLFRISGMMGLTGYLPLYLREELGWEIAASDGTLAAFYGVSTLCVVPLSYISDRIGSRKIILYTGAFFAVFCIGLLPLVDGVMIWVLMIICGAFMDGFMSLTVTTLLETEGVGPVYSGTALGALFTIGHVGSVASPPLGNSLASISGGAPFFFWAALSLIGFIPLYLVKETGWKAVKKTG
ncbi:MAG: MFS transporter [Dehalococcoidia bacterium]